MRKLALLLTLPAALAVEAADRPNILLIVSEDNGPELGCYGDPFARTPNLDQLAAEGVRFENAFVTYSVCSPSRASFLTGLHPQENGQIGLATHKFAMYSSDTPNFASIFRGAGYRTGLIGKLHVNPEAAFPFHFRAIPGANFRRKTTAEAYVEAAREFWSESQSRPWFLSVNFPDAHLPFLRQASGRPAKPLTGKDVKPLPWAGGDSPRIREVTADYYNCLARLDDWTGLLLDALQDTGAKDNTLVIYFGDHGAQFPRGKGTVYEGGLRVPLIMRWPAHIESGLVRNELVSTVDLLPTALDVSGIEPASELTGRSLRPLFREGEPADWRRYIFGFTTGSFPRACYVQHSIRDQRWKLISNPLPDTGNLDADTYLDESHPHFVVSGVKTSERTEVDPKVEAAWAGWERPPRYELYDLKSDPHEWHNLAGDPAHARVRERLVQALTDFQQETRDPFIDPANVKAYVKEQLANRDLAYRKKPAFRWTYLDTFPKWRADAGK